MDQTRFVASMLSNLNPNGTAGSEVLDYIVDMYADISNFKVYPVLGFLTSALNSFVTSSPNSVNEPVFLCSAMNILSVS